MENLKNDFVMVDQVRRASLSISSNIAEGFGRGGNKEFIRFLKISKASALELRSQLVFIYQIQYLEKDFVVNLISRLDALSIQISKFITYLGKNSSHK